MRQHYFIRFLYTTLMFLTFTHVGTFGLGKTNENKYFQAGAAIANITPYLGGKIVGEWETPPAIHVHDDLYARCLVLEDGSTKLVFVVLDLLGVHSSLTEMAKKIITQRLNIPPNNIIISVTHTHSGVSSMGEKMWLWNHYPFDDYQNFIINRIADVVQIAHNNIEPAQIGWGVAKAPEHVFVRRWKMKEPILNPFGGYDRVLTNPGVGNENKLEITADADPDVSFISVQSKKGKPIALYANYSLHYVGGIESGHISADYFGMFANRISELVNADKLNPLFVGILSTGTQGDVNNINFTVPAEQLPPYSKAEFVANDIAQKVYEVYKKITYYDWVPLRTHSEKILLKVRKPNKRMVIYADSILMKVDYCPKHPWERVFAERTLNQLKLPNYIEVDLTTFGIGDLGIASTPFQLFAAIGLNIKSKSPFKQTFVIGLADGYYGYVPTPEQIKLGGYETWFGLNQVEEDASEKIVNQIIKQFSKIKKM